jgi:SAM-dependent methyltransferase
MSGFSAQWLALREGADARARAAPLVARLREALAPDAAVLDLGAGTGANARHLVPQLGDAHAWTLVDYDDALLATLPARMPPGVRWQALRTDLRELARLPFPPRGLVTASALLDLVSGPWIDALAACCARAEACALFALSYDGRIAFDPPHRLDARVCEWVNRHQRTDKGFGPALGPEAVAAAKRAFEAHGYRCVVASSDWVLGPADAALQAALIDGWAEAAQAIAPEAGTDLAAWREARRAAAGRTRLVVGHADLVALPPMPVSSQS